MRSVIEPLLPVRSRLPRLRPPLAPPPTTLPLPTEDVEPRLIMRFVRMFSTGSGEVALARRAAAAAAEEREACELDVCRKAELAAAVAEAKVLLSTGCRALDIDSKEPFT